MDYRVIKSNTCNLRINGSSDFLLEYIDENLLLRNIIPDFNIASVANDRNDLPSVSFLESNKDIFKEQLIKYDSEEPLNIGQVSYFIFHQFQKQFIDKFEYTLEGASLFAKDKGILLIGSSGSGKTSSAIQLHLMDDFQHGGDEIILLDYNNAKLNYIGGNIYSAINEEYARILVGDKVANLDLKRHISKLHKSYIKLPQRVGNSNIDYIFFIGISDKDSANELTGDYAANRLFKVISEHSSLSSYTWLRTQSPLSIVDNMIARKKRLEDVISIVNNPNIKILDVRGTVKTLPQIIKKQI